MESPSSSRQSMEYSQAVKTNREGLELDREMTEEVDLRHKRSRQEESTSNIKKSSSDIKETYELIRDMNDQDTNMSVTARYNFDPPKIAKFLDFAVKFEKVNIKKRTQKIMTRFFEGQLEETETEAKELAKLITGDPRLGDFLDKDFIKLLFNFLGDQQNRGLQFNAVTIIRHVVAGSTNREVVKQYVTTSIILDLVSSKDRELQVQAMWLLRTIALGIPDHHEIETILEKALDPVISFLSDGSPSPEMIYLGALTLATFCQVYPNLPQEKFKLVLLALRKLIQYDINQYLADAILPYPCSAFAYLCDGREAMVVEDDFFGEIIERLIVFIDSDFRSITNSGLEAVGSIVRWASDDHIQVMIEKDLLWSLECLIREEHKYFVMYGCWILSNITARKQVFLKDVIRCECIESLVSVVQNFKFIEGRKEAAWAILNAICGASDEHIIEFLRKSCVRALWNFPTVFSGDLNIVYTCLKVLVKMEVVMVNCNGKLIDNVQFKNYLITLQERQFQLVDDIDGLPKSKKLRTTDNLGKYDSDMEYLITFTYEEDSDLQQPGTPKYFNP